MREPLGDWKNQPRQSWQYFVHLPTLTVYHIMAGFVTQHYPPLVIHNPRTRSQCRPWYDFQHSHPTQLFPDELSPATVVHNGALHGSLFHINYSSNRFPQPSTSLSQPRTTPYAMFLDLPRHPLPLLQLQAAAEAGNMTAVCGSNLEIQASLTTATISFYSSEELYNHTMNALLTADC